MRNLKLLLVLLLVAAFIPYLIASFYSLPFADDFCFGWTASEHISFLQKFLKQYLHWNGRYTSDVLVNLHPLITGSLWLYHLVSFISIVATPLAFFILIKQWVNDFLTAVIAALFISLFYLCYQPNITEGVYWYIGMVNYHWGSLLLVVELALLSKLLKAEGKNLIALALSLLLLIVAVGFNEIGAALIPAYYLAMVIYFKSGTMIQTKQKKNVQILTLHFVVAVIASAFVICSPGNFTRANEFPERFNFVHSFLYAGAQTIRFILRWGVSIPFIALSLLVVVNAHKVHSIALRKVRVAIWLTLLLLTVFMAAFIPYVATGILGQHRTMNYVLPFFILLWICTLISLSAHYGIADEQTPETRGVRVYILAIVALVIMSFSSNGGKIWSDLYFGNFPKYKSEFLVRQAKILQQPAATISSLKNIPNTFQVVDVMSDTTWWVDKCMKRFYTETNIVLH